MVRLLSVVGFALGLATELSACNPSSYCDPGQVYVNYACAVPYDGGGPPSMGIPGSGFPGTDPGQANPSLPGLAPDAGADVPPTDGRVDIDGGYMQSLGDVAFPPGLAPPGLPVDR
jgi:hypothetical protein